jgi:hypothetical protein
MIAITISHTSLAARDFTHISNGLRHVKTIYRAQWGNLG